MAIRTGLWSSMYIVSASSLARIPAAWHWFSVDQKPQLGCWHISAVITVSMLSGHSLNPSCIWGLIKWIFWRYSPVGCYQFHKISPSWQLLHQALGKGRWTIDVLPMTGPRWWWWWVSDHRLLACTDMKCPVSGWSSLLPSGQASLLQALSSLLLLPPLGWQVPPQAPEALSSFFFNIYFFIFGRTGSLLLCGIFSSCAVRLSHCGHFSCCVAWALGHADFSRNGSQAPEHRLSSCDPWA